MGNSISERMTDASPTLNALIDAYVAEKHNPHAERRCKWPKSLEAHFVAVRALWGHMTIDAFCDGSKARVKAQVQAWREAGLRQSTCRKRISVLRTAIRFAIEEEIIKPGQMPVFKLPANGPPRERFLDDEKELPALLYAADELETPDHIRLLLELALRTGQRRGAILALRWEHIDLDKRVIRFRDTEDADERSKKRRGNKPMDDDLYKLMVWALARRSDETDHVIHWRDRPVRSPYAGMRALYKRAGLTAIHTHDLRRSSATFVHTETKGDLKAAASHIVDTEATARKHYVQEVESVHLPAIEAVSAVLARARKAG